MYVRYLNKQKNTSNNENILTKTTFTPLESILKIFGLSCVSSDGKKLKYSWPVCKIAITATSLLIANSISIYLSLTTITYKRSKVTIRDYIPLIYLLGYVQYIVSLTFVYKYGRQRCLNYYNVFENIDRVITMPYYNEIRRSVTKICIFFIFIGACYFISDYTALVMSRGWSITAIHGIDYIYTAIKMLSALDGISHCAQVKFRLKRMEDILKEYYGTVESLPGVTQDVICKKDFASKERDILKEYYGTVEFLPGVTQDVICKKESSHQTLNGLGSLNIIGQKHPKVILQLSRCYILLLEQCEYINGMFGFRILLGSLVYLLEMVMLTNFMVRLTIGTMVPFYESGILPLLSTGVKIVNYSSVLLWGLNGCEQTYRQSERIVRCLDHLLANKKLTIEADEALKELRELITTRPVSFRAMNFYSLDYPAILSMASAVVTYTIILLQNLQ